MNIILVTGGRNYANRAQLHQYLYQVHNETPIDILVHGNARGADTMADDWAEAKGIQRAICPAAWDRFDAAIAGHRRNRFMLELGPTLVVAFPGGAGTNNMVTQAQHKGVRLLDLRALK